MPSRIRTLTAVAALAALPLTACGPDDGTSSAAKEDPKGTVVDAFAAYEDADTIEMTLSLDVDDATTDAILDDSDIEAGSTEEAAMRDVLAGTVTVAVHAPADADDQDPVEALRATSMAFDARTAHGEGGELRVIDGVLYARADVDALIGRYGDGAFSDADVAQMEAMLSFGAPLMAGEWLSLDLFQTAEAFGADPADFAKELTASADTPAFDQAAALEVLRDAIDRAPVTYEGTSDGADRFSVVVDVDNVDATITELVAVLDAGQMAWGAEESAELRAAFDEVGGQFTVGVEVRDGRVAALELDLGGMTEEIPGEMVVRVELDTASDLLTVPDATAIAPGELFGLLGMAFTG